MRYTDTVHDVRFLFEENKDRLFAYLIRMTGDVDLAGDILQESFTRYMEHYGTENNSGALLFTIARNAVFDHNRRSSRIVELLDDHSDSRTDQEHSLMVKDSYQRVMKGFHALDEDERDILSMVVSSDLSYREIAAIHGISVANIKVKVHRARVKLRNILEGEE